MNQMITLNQAFPNGFIGNGIFEYMPNTPWSDMFSAGELDLQFFSEYGKKPVAPIIEHFYVDGGLSDESRQRIATMLYNRFKVQWKHKYDILSVEYNPIENYKMVESGTDSDSGTDTDVHSNSETGTDTTQSTSTGGTTTNTNNTNAVYGFNSESAVNSDAISGTGSIQNTTETTDTRTVDLTNNGQNTKTVDMTHEHQFQRSGNIGVTTSQQMIQSEIELWNWNFLDDVFKDVASVLTLSIYRIEI